MQNYPMWRWDQGRLAYFQFDNLRLIAESLCQLEGVILSQGNIDPIRQELVIWTGLPFAPNTYKVWRNYKRVFECSLLATNYQGRLFVSDIAKKISLASTESIDVDDYMALFIPRFRYPFPAFNENQSDIVVYPCIAVLKLLLAKFSIGKIPVVSLEEVFEKLIANEITGLEETSHYLKITPKSISINPDQNRQVREMLIFISQMSILKWQNGKLYLDITMVDFEATNGLELLINPVIKKIELNREEEFISLTNLHGNQIMPFTLSSRDGGFEDLFIEGRKRKVTHFKIERSPLLRKMYFERYPSTTCEMCDCDTKKSYPWTENILEIHHILPLSSTLSITGEGTSLSDVVGLCPNCHKSVHIFYKNWFVKYSLDDFKSKEQAIEVYYEAKNSILV